MTLEKNPIGQLELSYLTTLLLSLNQRLWVHGVKMSLNVQMNSKVEKTILEKNNKQIAHDLRSPLSALHFISSMNPDLPEASREILEMAIVRLTEIADSLDQ